MFYVVKNLKIWWHRNRKGTLPGYSKQFKYNTLHQIDEEVTKMYGNTNKSKKRNIKLLKIKIKMI